MTAGSLLLSRRPPREKRSLSLEGVDLAFDLVSSAGNHPRYANEECDSGNDHGGDLRGRTSFDRAPDNDFRYRRRVFVLEVEEHHLPIERTETLNQPMESIESTLSIEAVFPIDGVCDGVEILVDRHQRAGTGARPEDAGNRGVVRHAIDPRAQRASAVIARETSPQRHVNRSSAD